MKREAPRPLTSTEDKRARFEAGLDLDLSRDLSDLQAENILKEVSAPTVVQNLITGWTEKLCTFLSGLELPKSSREKLLADTGTHCLSCVPAGFKVPSARVTSVLPAGPLASCSLVFPNAVGRVTVFLNYKKIPKTCMDRMHMLVGSLVSLQSTLSSSKLVDSVQLVYRSWSTLPALEISPPSDKLNQHLKVHLEVCLDDDQSLATDSHGVNIVLQEELNRLLSSHSNYKTGCQLLEIWTRQLKLLLPVNLLPVLLLHLHLTNQLTTAMKPWQVVRRLWTFLSETVLLDFQILLGTEKPILMSAKASPFLDRDGSTVLFPEYPICQWDCLAQWATSALTVSLKEALLVKQNTGALYDKVVVFTGETVEPCKLILDLQFALGDRITRMSGIQGCGSDREFCVGLNLNPSNYFHSATHGPQSDDPKAKQFRDFWGDRSELRRFPDGAVKEVVVWGNRKDEVIGNLVRAVAARHHPGVDVQEKGNWQSLVLCGDGGEAVRQELDVLTPVLYGLEGLPLAVSGVSGYGEEVRLSRVGVRATGWKIGGKIVKEKEGVAVLLGKANMAPPEVQCLDVMLQAEHSGKWPKDQEAVRRLKVAWLEEVGKALSKKVEGLKHRILGERLVVVTPSREVVLRFCVGDKGKDTVGHLCQFSSWLGGVAKTNHAWSGGVRLAKRWVSAHLLAAATAIPDTAVEVLMAKIFLNPGEFGLPPVSPVAAFYRWLQLVSHQDWNEAPVIVSAEMTECSEARDKLPPLAVISPHDPSPSYWTRPGPTWPELQRLVTFAAQSLKLAEEQQGGEDEYETVEKLFTPAMDSFEFLIELKPLQVPNRSLKISRQMTELSKVEDRSCCIPIVEFNPVQCLLLELQESYGHLASFYYDKYGGTTIAVKLKQNKKDRVKVGELAGHMTRGKETELNWGALVEDWGILGDGLIKNIQCRDTEHFL